jgi:hypothetical protein
VVRVLDVDVELLERQDRLAPHVGARVQGGEVEVPALVQDLGRPVLRLGRAKVEVLELGADVVGLEAHLLGALQGSPQDPPRIALVWLPARDLDVAEHPPGGLLQRAPGQDREAGRIGQGDHVGLLDRIEPRDRGPVEAHTALERVLELLRVDREALQLAEHVREPQPDEPNVTVPDHLHHVVGGLGAYGGGVVGHQFPPVGKAVGSLRESMRQGHDEGGTISAARR